MKRILLIISLLAAVFAASAQEITRAEYLRKYTNLVNRVGPGGLGVETLLDKWEAEWPDDPQQMLARFSFCITRARSTQIVQLDKDRYLGRDPIIPMKDSTGRKCNYFEDYEFDEDLYAQANLCINKAIEARPFRLDYRMAKIDAMLAFEKEQPEMTLVELKALADKNAKERPVWEYEGLDRVSEDQFKAFMQDYCVALFRLGSDASAEAFRDLSAHLLTYYKNEPLFLNNLGSYYLVKNDYKQAQKYFDMVLKKHPDDMSALKNSLLMARAKKDPKLEKKYLALMAQHGATETDRASAQMRLDAFGKK